VKRKISAILFDLGGVLTRPQDPECVRELMDWLGLDGEVERFKAAYFAHRDEYDRGTLGVEEYWRAVAADIGAAPAAAGLPRAIERDLDAWMQYRPGMLEVLTALRPRIRRLGLLSNINFEGARRLRSSFPRLELFDQLTLSCELGLMKPEPGIFASCLRSLGAEPSESLFVDDSVANVEGARAAGLYSFRFIDEEQFTAELATFYELLA